ncbi:hypothetical protein QJS66_17100 [Kocuria rhizophila]|nr:hypothetical protein QJS66_17100 [Kocuria rhizophila]
MKTAHRPGSHLPRSAPRVRHPALAFPAVPAWPRGDLRGGDVRGSRAATAAASWRTAGGAGGRAGELALRVAA